MSKENRLKSVNVLGSVRQTITADHHIDPKQSAIEQARWPRIWATDAATQSLTGTGKPPMTRPKESAHAEETRPTRDE